MNKSSGNLSGAHKHATVTTSGGGSGAHVSTQDEEKDAEAVDMQDIDDIPFDGSPPSSSDEKRHSNDQEYPSAVIAHQHDGRCVPPSSSMQPLESHVPPSLFGFMRSLLPTVFGARVSNRVNNTDRSNYSETQRTAECECTLTDKTISDAARSGLSGEAEELEPSVSDFQVLSQEFDGSPPDSPPDVDDFPSSEDADDAGGSNEDMDYAGGTNHGDGHGHADKDAPVAHALHVSRLESKTHGSGASTVITGHNTAMASTTVGKWPSTTTALASSSLPTGVFCPCCQAPLPSHEGSAAVDTHVENCVTQFVLPAIPCPSGAACTSTTERHFR